MKKTRWSVYDVADRARTEKTCRHFSNAYRKAQELREKGINAVIMPKEVL